MMTTKVRNSDALLCKRRLNLIYNSSLIAQQRKQIGFLVAPRKLVVTPQQATFQRWAQKWKTAKKIHAKVSIGVGGQIILKWQRVNKS